MLLISMTWLGREWHRFCAKFSPIPQLYQSRGWGTWRWKIAPLGCNCLQFSARRLELSSVSEVRFLFEIGGEWTDVRATLHQGGDKGGRPPACKTSEARLEISNRSLEAQTVHNHSFRDSRKQIRKKEAKGRFQRKKSIKKCGDSPTHMLLSTFLTTWGRPKPSSGGG